MKGKVGIFGGVCSAHSPKVSLEQGIAKSGAKVQNLGFRFSISPKTNFIRFLFLNLTHKNSFWLASVQNRNFRLRFPRLRQYPKRYEQLENWKATF
jgi:hypothetical protein